jgi:hypothetical protein
MRVLHLDLRQYAIGLQARMIKEGRAGIQSRGCSWRRTSAARAV